MKQKRAGGWGYYFVVGVTALARNRTACCMLVEAHPAYVPFSTLVQIFGCMLETVHPRPALVRIAGCMLECIQPLLRLECTCRCTWGWGAGLGLSNEVGVYEKP